MPEQNEVLDIDVADVTDASWEDLVQVMMTDELDAVSIQAGTICACSCTFPSCGC